MRSEKKTTPSASNMPYTLFSNAINQTPVGQSSSLPTKNLQGESTIPVSAERRTPAGLILLRSTPFLQAAVATRLRNIPASLRSLQLKPYARTLELLRQKQQSLRKQQRDPGLFLNLAWISLNTSRTEFNRRVLESFELSLAHTLFVVTQHPQQSVEAVCSENTFDAIVLEAPATPVTLKQAQRWIKPSAHNPLQPESANRLETHPRERLFILIDDSRGGI